VMHGETGARGRLHGNTVSSRRPRRWLTVDE
jgi:hypothetical protein